MVRDALILLADKNALPPASLKKIKGINWQWIQTKPLFEVAIRLLVIHYITPHAIDGSCLAFLAKRLISCEVNNGGPYKDKDGRTDVATNVAFAQLFARLGTLPSNLSHFIHQPNHSPSIHVSKGITTWLLSWPTALQSVRSTYYLPSGRITSQYTQSSTRALATINTLNEPLRTEARRIWTAVNRINRKHEITHIATFFAQSLASPLLHATDTLYHDLGEANFYAWMAYTIYDDFIDSDGHTPQLNVANAMHRRSLLLYTKHAPPTINPWQYFDQMDEANAWELAYCRADVTNGDIHLANKLPRYHSLSMLAARSSAHILGPLIITATAQSHYQTLQAVEQGLRHYLIAKQLNDDIHDWKNDLAQGHLSPVVTYLLEKTNITNGTFSVTEITPILQRYFWKNGLKNLSRRVIYHVKKSKEILLKDNFINSDKTPFFTHILSPVEASVRQGYALQKAQKEFLVAYKST